MKLHIFTEWAAVAAMPHICMQETCGLNIDWAINHPERGFWFSSETSPLCLNAKIIIYIHC